MVNLILWSTLKPKYWQYFSYFIAKDLEDYTIWITKLQSTEPSFSMQNLQALYLIFWQCIGSHLFPGEKLKGNFADADDKLWGDKGSADPIHYPTWVWNFGHKCYWYINCWWLITAIIWNVCLIFPQKRLVV